MEQPGDLPVLTEAGAIRALSAEEAGRHYPVRLRAIVTYADPAWSMLFVQDESGGVYVDSQHVADWRAGDLIELEGFTDPGNFAPQIVRPTIRVVGRAPLPPGKRADVERLLTGMEDSQWVETTGVVRAVSRDGDNHVLLHIAAGRSRFSVVVPPLEGPAPVHLLDSLVRVSGVAGTLFNQKRQLIGVQLYVPSLDHVAVERDEVGDPFAAPSCRSTAHAICDECRRARRVHLAAR